MSNVLKINTYQDQKGYSLCIISSKIFSNQKLLILMNPLRRKNLYCCFCMTDLPFSMVHYRGRYVQNQRETHFGFSYNTLIIQLLHSFEYTLYIQYTITRIIRLDCTCNTCNRITTSNLWKLRMGATLNSRKNHIWPLFVDSNFTCQSVFTVNNYCKQ